MTAYTVAERRAIEAALPPSLRGVGPGYRRMLAAIPLRVSVSGIRGKSGLTMMIERALRERGRLVYAKQTGTDPVSYKDGVAHPIDRRGRKVRLDETAWELKRFFPFDACVVENQALGEYTMRTFNERVVQPHVLVVTNVRRDHQGDIARTLPGLARAFGRSANAGTLLVTGEQRTELRAILQREAEARGARFESVHLPPGDYVPGMENVRILDRVLQEATGRGLGARALAEREARLRDHFRWWPSSRPGLRWFHGAEINDVDSTDAILRHLAKDDDGPVAFVAYFRPDRRDRTASFVGFLRQAFAAGRAARAYLVGPGAAAVAMRLRRWSDRVTTWPDDPAGAEALLERVVTDGARLLMTVANAVPPFPRAFARAVAAVGDPRQSYGGTDLRRVSFVSPFHADGVRAVTGRPVAPAEVAA